jgi:lipid-A-disaccharide synthase-like uncharacterized protein
MVAWSDFLSANPDAQVWHFVLGVAIGLLVVVVFRINPYVSAALLAGFVAFVIAKEWWIATYIENETANQEAVSITFWALGGGLGMVLGVLPKKVTFITAAVLIPMVIGLLLAGVV